jgi:tetratricopeptide (TPR) repeat protein
MAATSFSFEKYYHVYMAKFDKSKSVLKEVYGRFSANDPGELRIVYLDADQELMKQNKWDYGDTTQISNQIVSMIEEVGIENVKDEKEQRWIKHILWMWHHHAISCALWRYGDKQAAQFHAQKALELQPKDHPNKITRLLFYLVFDRLTEAEEWAGTITTEPEKTTAQYDLRLYKKGDFFKSG